MALDTASAERKRYGERDQAFKIVPQIEAGRLKDIGAAGGAEPGSSSAQSPYCRLMNRTPGVRSKAVQRSCGGYCR